MINTHSKECCRQLVIAHSVVDQYHSIERQSQCQSVLDQQSQYKMARSVVITYCVLGQYSQYKMFQASIHSVGCSGLVVTGQYILVTIQSILDENSDCRVFWIRIHSVQCYGLGFTLQNVLNQQLQDSFLKPKNMCLSCFLFHGTLKVTPKKLALGIQAVPQHWTILGYS